MKLISFEDILKMEVAPAQCVAWVDEALRMKGESMLPPKVSLKPAGMHGVFYNTMPSLLPGIGRGGVKLVTRYPGRAPALNSEILLYDLATGKCLALMDGDWITAMRTGAVAAHTIGLLAKPGFKRVGMMGLGNTARATLACLSGMLPGENMEIGLLRYKDQHIEFKRRFDGLPGISFTEFDDVATMAEWSDVFVSCVTAAIDGDLCSPERFKPGALLVPVHTQGFAECDLVFDKVFCDDEGHVSGFKYYSSFKPKLSEVADVVCRRSAGRESDGERILAYNVGISLHDIYFAAKLDEMADSLNVGVELAVGKSEAKFWV